MAVLMLLPSGGNTADMQQPYPDDSGALVHRFVEAFNRHDIDAMLQLVDKDISWFSVDGESIVVETRNADELRVAMMDYFVDRPSAYSRLLEIWISGRFVSALEQARRTKDPQSPGQCSVSVYETAGGLIKNVWYYPAHQCPEPEIRAMSDMGRDKRINYIELASTDIEQSKAFFGNAFGWTFVDYGPEYASFDDGVMSGGFRKEESVTAGGPLVILYADDLEATRDRVARAGGTIVKEIFSFPGGRRFHFTDPSGNELAVWSEQ